MPDNIGYTPGAGASVAAREVTYSGDTVKAQAVGLVTFEGPDDGKSVKDIGPDNPLPVVSYRAEQMLGQLVQATVSPPNYDSSLRRQRVTAVLESGTVSQVTTVNTVSNVANQTNIGGLPAQMLINQTDLSAWADCVRARIT
jgi:hypothetical protein